MFCRLARYLHFCLPSSSSDVPRGVPKSHRFARPHTHTYWKLRFACVCVFFFYCCCCCQYIYCLRVWNINFWCLIFFLVVCLSKFSRKTHDLCVFVCAPHGHMCLLLMQLLNFEWNKSWIFIFFLLVDYVCRQFSLVSEWRRWKTFHFSHPKLKNLISSVTIIHSNH